MDFDGKRDVAKKIEEGGCAGAEDMKIDGVLVNGLEVNQDEEYEADEWVFEDLSGRWLDGDKVAEAQSEDIGYMEKELDMFVPANWEECVAETGRPPISTKWVDVNKDTVRNQIIRSKLVARDFRVKGESDRSDPLCGDAAFGGQAHVVSHGRSAFSVEAV